MTTRIFTRPDPTPPPKPPGGGVVALNPPLIVPVAPPKSIWGIVFPIALIVGVVGFIVFMYASGMRSFANGFGLFGIMMLVGMGGMLFRRGGPKMTWGQITAGRRTYFDDLDQTREKIDTDRRTQWAHRHHYHPAPAELAGLAGTARMWERGPDDDEFAVVRVGVGKVRFCKDPAQLNIGVSADLEPATGHALQKFLLHQFYIDDTPKTVWLQRFPGMSIIGEPDATRGLARAMICQLAAAHSPTHVQIIVVSGDTTEWEWVKWLPHTQHRAHRDGCGEARLLFTSPADLDTFLETHEEQRDAWTPPPATPGLTAAPPPVLPLRVIIDDAAGAVEDWEGLTGGSGYAGTFFLRLTPAAPHTRPATGAKHWVGFDPLCSYRITDAALRKQLPDDQRPVGAGRDSDEMDAVFAARPDTVSLAAATRIARALAPWRADSHTRISKETTARTVADAVGAHDPRRADYEHLWSARRVQGKNWMRFPAGIGEDGQIIHIDLKEGAHGGFGCHGLMIGNTGSGKSVAIMSMVTALAMTHSPDVANVAFIDFKMKSIAGILSRIPHVVAAVSNLRTEIHLVGRMYEALEGELDRRGALCDDLGHDVVDLNVYNERRLTDANLPAVPALWIIVDEYQELLGHPVWGPKFRELFWRIGRQGRAYHMFLLLVGQTVDGQKLMDIDKILGYRIAARTGTEQESHLAIHTRAAAHIHEFDEKGVAYLKVGQREPRKLRFFYSQAPFTPPPETGVAPLPVGTWFTPRLFTGTETPDIDGLLAAPAAAAEPETVGGEPLIEVVTDALQRTGDGPPSELWLPPLGAPPAADDLVMRYRGQPWSVDYGNNPGLRFPIALEDRPRDHQQHVHILDVVGNNAMIIAAPQMGSTTAVMTMIVAAALMYTPGRLQFYCVAASGPQLAAVEALPHVAAVVAGHDSEGVNRLLATVTRIVETREKLFARAGLDIDTVRAAGFTDVDGGDIVVVIDGWQTFAEQAGERGVEAVMALMRARNYGIRVVFTSTDYVAKIRTGMRSEIGQRLELRLTDPTTSVIPRVDGAIRAAEVPKTPGRGLSPDGYHLIVGVPELAGEAAGRVLTRGVAAAIAPYAGSSKPAVVRRLPETITYPQMRDIVKQPLPKGVVPFGLSEWDLGPACLDFAEYPHVVAVGLAQTGRTNWLRTVARSIMASYSRDEAEIIVFDHRRKLIGVVPDDWPHRYCYTPDDIRRTVDGDPATNTPGLLDVFTQRTPPPGTSQTDLLKLRFWKGREIFIIVDDATSWRPSDSPLTKLAPWVQQADHLGFHLVMTADITKWGVESATSGVLGKIAESLAPIYVMGGHHQYGRIVGDLRSEPQRPGKGVLWTPAGQVGVLTAWSEPPNRQPDNTAGQQNG